MRRGDLFVLSWESLRRVEWGRVGRVGLNGADLAVLVVPFLDGSSNRVEAGTDLEVHSIPFGIFDIGMHCKPSNKYFSLS